MKYVAFLLVALSAITSLAPTGAAQIRLNEVLADPARDWDGDGQVSSKLDEWVEIVNIGSSSVDLSRYRISDASAGIDWRFALAGTLAPGAVRVVFGSEVVAWQSANGVGQFGFSLNNGGDTVSLYEVVGSDTTEVDSYQYASSWVADDRSVGRHPIGSGIWVVFDGLNPFSGTDPSPTGCMPSPGTTTQCTTPVELSTWGTIKSRYKD